MPDPRTPVARIALGRCGDQTGQRKSVLITRPAEDAATPAAHITAQGYTPILAPLLTITRRTLPLQPNIQAILVTSGNALASLTPNATPLFAVGDATAARARAQGFPNVHSAGRDAQALAELATHQLSPANGPLLLASGARQGIALATNLRARGFTISRRVAYSATPVRRFPPSAIRAIRSGNLHAALFLSAETAAVFVRLLPQGLQAGLTSVRALAIGPAAAAVLEKLAWGRIDVASNPTLDDVLALI